MCNKFPGFKDFVLENEFTIVAVTETWLQYDEPDDHYYLPGYKLVRNDRGNKRGGGVALYVADYLKFSRLEFPPETSSIEVLLLRVNTGKLTTGVGVVYRPNDTNSLNLNIISDIVNCFFCNRVDNFVILGDFNVNLLGSSSSSKLLHEVLEQHDCIQTVKDPTRVTALSTSLLDLTITNLTHYAVSSEVLAQCFSDHNVVVSQVKIKHEAPKWSYKVVRSFRDFCFNTFSQDASLLDWNLIYRLESLEDKVDCFNYFLLSLYNKHAPLRVVKVRSHKPHNPWFTDTLQLIRKLVRKAWSKFTKSHNLADKLYYCSLRNYYNHALMSEKRAYFSTHIKCNRHDPKHLWQQLKKWNVVAGKDCNATLPENLLDPDLLNDYFISSVPSFASNPSNIDSFMSSCFDNDSVFRFPLPAVQEVVTEVLNLKANIEGADGISGRMLQIALPFIKLPLTHLINSSFETGIVPYQWKLGSTFPYLKGGSKNKTELSPSDLRPITILPVCLKVTERLMYTRLVDYVEDLDILPKIQSGFRKGYSTTSALCKIVDDITTSVDSGLVTSLTLLDLSKAFDSVNISLLLAKLQYYGIQEEILQWFSSYLNDRTQFTVVRCAGGMARSEGRTIFAGVPQGSILGPLLFSLYIADLQRVVEYSSLHLYADDIQLYCSFPLCDSSNAQVHVNSDLDRMYDWTASNCLKLNFSKCQHMLIGTKHSVQAMGSFHLFINGNKVPEVKAVTNLGVIIDNELSFTPNVSRLCKRAYFAWKQLLPFRDLLDSSTKLLLVETFVLSLLNYADIIYGPYITYADKYRLQKVQNLCIRYVTRVPLFTHITPFIRSFHCLKMHERRFLHYVAFLHKVIQTQCPSYLYEKLMRRSAIHDRNLRHTDVTFNIPLHSTALFKHSYSYLSAYIYNTFVNKYENVGCIAVKKTIKAIILSGGLTDVDLRMF